MSLDQQPPHPSVSERRGQRLAPLQTNFSRPNARASMQFPPPAPASHPALAQSAAPSRPQRPRPSDYQTETEVERIPLQQTPPVKRQSSKSGLRGLFGREKVSRKSSNDARLAEIEEAQSGTVPQTVTIAETPLSPSLCATPKTVISITTAASSSGDSNRTRLSSKSRGKSSEDRPVAPDHAWKPPPLFQAYPQAIKHDCLWTPAMSSDSILRIHATAKNSDSTYEDPQGNQPQTDESSAERKKKEKEKKHMRSVSETIGKTEWSQKVYVLVTSGYILQYAGSGKHDRLPERMLQICPKSVAFASDAIPGKHWVLQVSQSSDEEGATAVDTHRPLFSRLGFHRSHARRWTRSFLLVFGNPEEMSAWLLAVRAQIEAHGGKKYVSERLYDEELQRQLRPKQSMRQMVQKDPNRISSIYLQPQPQSAGPDDKDSAISDQSRRSSYMSLHRRSMVIQPGSDSRSNSISTAHTDVTPPLNGNSNCFGHSHTPVPPSTGSSSNGGTVPAAQGPISSSPPKRHSLLYASISTTETYELPQSLSTVPDPILRSTSPPAPNFSVPSFSKRFAAKNIQAQFSHIHPVDSDQTSLNRSHDPDDQLDPLSAFPSPPQSPTRNMSRTGMNDINEHPSVTRDAFHRRQLRMSNSEDSLADPHPKTYDYRNSPMSRLPSISAAMSSAIAHSFRPSSIALDPLASHPDDLDAPRTALDRGEPIRRDPHRTRVSVLYPTDPTGRPLSMARRKSMPGLSAGPPAAPPPNCPLPKLPPLGHPSQPPSSPPPIRSCKSPPLTDPRDHPENLNNATQPVSSTPFPSTTPSIDTRVVSGL
ncbi:peptidase family M20/M25/M40 protein [Aspergillus clavatus NRRL 1]|uniref:Peptidase family M20/M25/M40 protein n=1 Tax=Aspergillus clavatus (strain ATCC 1007 / CBS 513.65 / DSM 816 / NCTC 3887 / NRRL 1 / QM 1276 / 107) TaxID=344612 RepID=A1C6U2_ASPCL|nr:uncharacterized protein ACLA_071460 [Aspergillus clavatus NRRL 1]EAW14113.1 conserved hypothetical protein [Aspergillus clavatus NRRL 1]